MSGPLVVFCEQRDGQLKKVALEAIGAAVRLGQDVRDIRPVHAVLIGSSVADLAGEVGRYGAAEVLIAEDAALRYYDAEAYCTILAEVVERLQAGAVLMGATAMGKDLAPKLAARLRSFLATDCVALSMEPDGTLCATRPVFGGKLRQVLRAGSPSRQVVSLRPNLFAPLPPTARPPKIQRLAIPTTTRPSARVREVQASGDDKQVELTEAAIIVSGGRGLKGPEHFHLVEELAAAFGGAVGASRAVVDAGWKPHSYQVGLTGKTVSPQLYVACGISGAIQHQAGMSSARVIVAINNNPNAPIFKLATYGIVGDLFEVLPLLTDAVKRAKADG